jgi:hypothetical protein
VQGEMCAKNGVERGGRRVEPFREIVSYRNYIIEERDIDEWKANFDECYFDV